MTITAPAPTRERSRWNLFWTGPAMRKLRRNRLAVTGLIITLLFGLVALFAPLIAKPGGNCLRDLNIASPNEVYNPLGGAFWRAVVAPPRAATPSSA